MAIKGYYLPVRGQKVGGSHARKGTEIVNIIGSYGGFKDIACMIVLLSVLSMVDLSEAKSIASNKLLSNMGAYARTNSVRASWLHNNPLDDTR